MTAKKVAIVTESGAERFITLNKLKKSPKNARKTPHSEASIEAGADVLSRSRGQRSRYPCGRLVPRLSCGRHRGYRSGPVLVGPPRALGGAVTA